MSHHSIMQVILAILEIEVLQEDAQQDMGFEGGLFL